MFRQVQPRPAWVPVPRPRSAFTQVPSANNYARQALANLARRGYSPNQFGIKGDAAAQWRALSPIAGALRSIQAGNPGGYQNQLQGSLGPTLNPAVAALVYHLLQSQQGTPVASGTTPITGMV